MQIAQEARERLKSYMRLILAENAVINLTSISDEDDFWEKHIMDSLSLQDWLPQGASLVDVGTGGGFPGIALKIARPDLKVSLVESIGKKLRAVERAAAKAGISGDLEFVCMRAEDAARLPKMREAYDAAACRALAPLAVALEWCAGFVRLGGRVIAMKGPRLFEEIGEAGGCESLLGLSPPKTVGYTLEPSCARRFLAIYKKTSATPKRYPRQAGAVKKKPLGSAKMP
ncbi:MAG: 16S rRNA (guanine(527)-N(7))-methyltransferase RsmG [Eubacteriaceae bacterium]|jgi:16S rRNA (guanine527-N7)-methyltransferase|nr:16S rRNA (guanine(527)-N(7))-methyltransferase RsmG [Eubacteriaceae bacterium]